jgi:hypothetical protein
MLVPHELLSPVHLLLRGQQPIPLCGPTLEGLAKLPGLLLRSVVLRPSAQLVTHLDPVQIADSLWPSPLRPAEPIRAQSPAKACPWQTQPGRRHRLSLASTPSQPAPSPYKIGCSCTAHPCWIPSLPLLTSRRLCWSQAEHRLRWHWLPLTRRLQSLLEQTDISRSTTTPSRTPSTDLSCLVVAGVPPKIKDRVTSRHASPTNSDCLRRPPPPVSTSRRSPLSLLSSTPIAWAPSCPRHRRGKPLGPSCASSGGRISPILFCKYPLMFPLIINNFLMSCMFARKPLDLLDARKQVQPEPLFKSNPILYSFREHYSMSLADLLFNPLRSIVNHH